MKELVSELFKVARCVLCSIPEQEVERLLRKCLVGTEFYGHVFSVGGYVRDEVLGVPSKDLDMVVELKEERNKEHPEGAKKLTGYLHSLFPKQSHRPLQIGKGYPIWRLVFIDDVSFQDEEFKTKGAEVEISDSMKETFPDATSRQRQTQWGTLQEDVERRDFTVNSLLKDMTTGEFVDLTGVSMADIKKGILRGNPMVSMDEIFNNDPLRMIRLVRFQAKYGWEIPKSVLKSVRRNADRIQIVSAERIMGELTKVMKMGKLSQAIKLMKATGLLQYILPEINAMRGVKQSPEFHEEGAVFTCKNFERAM
jgi:poly(A) polymerase